MTIIDTHVHFWDPARLAYPWMEPVSLFDRSFLPDDYGRVSEGVPIGRLIFVECDAEPRLAVAEAEWIESLVVDEPRISAIVARGPFGLSEWEEALERLAAMPLVRGIRDNIQGHPEGFALRDNFVRGVRAVHEQGLHFELCLTHDQLGEAIELVRRCAEGAFVLDHCAKPAIKAGLREPWRSHMETMASLPNVTCKISGLLTEADWDEWKADEILWYARTAAELFGIDRILFGSDWPVNELAGGFRKWFDVAETLVSGWAQADRDKFFRLNAERVYRL